MISNLIKNFNRKEDKIKPYLTFKSSTPMTITPNYTNAGITLQYSLDTVTWTSIAAKAVTPSAKVIYFRGRATGTKSLFTVVNISNAWVFTGATNLEVNGDITMLIQDILGGKVSDVPLASYCYSNMFYNCTSLIKAPNLPSTTLADNCYSFMLRDCNSLTTAPALPAIMLATDCYAGMFFGCINLTTSPMLPATKLAVNCYSNMLRGCNSLTTTPELPATTLATGCYTSMFYGCINLTTVPILPATTLANYCYINMFINCIKIKLSITKTGNYQTEYRVPIVGTGIDASEALKGMFFNTGGTFTGTPTINTTYYTENQVI